MIRIAIVVALLSPLAACVTEDHPLQGILIQPLSSHTDGDGNGGVLLNLVRCPVVMAGLCPAVTPHLRVRVNGDLLVQEDWHGVLTDDVLTVAPMASQVATLLPAGDYVVELVTDDDAVWSTSAFHLPPITDSELSQLFVSGDGAHSWFAPAHGIDALAPVAFDIINATNTPFDLERCEVDTAGGPASCASIGTVDPFGEWRGSAAATPASAVSAELRIVAGDQTLPGDDLAPVTNAYLAFALLEEPNGRIVTFFQSFWDF